jgi:carbon-monoxide dehydrogenase large subunit
MPMETHAAVAEWDPLDGPTLWTSTQQPHVVRNVAAQVFGLPQSKVRVRKPFVGGAFGHKEGLHTHEAMALLGARRLGRPVRFVLTRTEEFTATVSRNPQVRDVEIALRDDGTVLGWRERIVQDVGAYSGLGPSVLALSEWVTVGPYRTPALDEVMLDIAARALGTDPFELRRRNLIRQRDLPTRTANGLKLDTLPIEEAMTVAAEAIDLDGLRARLGPFQGIGIANMIEWGGGCRWLDDWDADIGSVTVTLQPDGSAVVASDAADSGQGHATLFTQITADLLGVEPATVAAMVHEDRKSLPPGMEAGALVATASYDTPSEVPDANGYGNFAANYTCSATIAVVEVDPATGKIRVLDWSSAEDAGRTLHPDLLKGRSRAASPRASATRSARTCCSTPPARC